MYIIVGLGNPGPRYKLTRHNVGFMVVDALADHFNIQFQESKFNALIAQTKLRLPSGEEDVLLVKPQTFMNLSGEAVQPLLAFYKIPTDKLLVIHDEVDIPFTEMRVQKNRGHGGQNGVRNIHEKIGPDYSRIRVGVGRPTIPQMGIADHVLQNFSPDEMTKLPDVLGEVCEKALDILNHSQEKGSIHGS